jgi:hypothetical protein
MGYAKTSQMAHGIFMRLRARSFIVSEPSLEEEEGEILIEEPILQQERVRLRWSNMFHDDKQQTLPSEISRLDPEKTICFVSMDVGMVSENLHFWNSGS